MDKGGKMPQTIGSGMYGAIDVIGNGLLVNVFQTKNFLADQIPNGVFYPYIQYLNQKTTNLYYAT